MEKGFNTDLMSYSSLRDLEPLEVADVSGVNMGNAEVGYREDGTRVYVKDVKHGKEDMVQSHIAASVFGDNLDMITPDIAYDDFYGKILMEEMPGEVSGEITELQEDSFHRAVAHKMLMGDTDYPGNILMTEATASAIDFDSTGRDMQTTKITLKTALGDRIKSDLLHQKASKLADQIDLYQLEQDMRNEPYLDDEWSNGEERTDDVPWQGLFDGSIDNILENVEMFQTQ